MNKMTKNRICRRIRDFGCSRSTYELDGLIVIRRCVLYSSHLDSSCTFPSLDTRICQLLFQYHQVPLLSLYCLSLYSHYYFLFMSTLLLFIFSLLLPFHVHFASLNTFSSLCSYHFYFTFLYSSTFFATIFSSSHHV